MHRLVLEDAIRRFRAVEQRVAGALDVARGKRVEHLAVRFGRELPHDGSRAASRPRRHRPVPACDSCGSMPRAKSCSSRCVDARTAQPTLHERVEAERRQVALVEHDRVAKGDRARVIRLGREQVEERLERARLSRYQSSRSRTVEPVELSRSGCRGCVGHPGHASTSMPACRKGSGPTRNRSRDRTYPEVARRFRLDATGSPAPCSRPASVEFGHRAIAGTAPGPGV